MSMPTQLFNNSPVDFSQVSRNNSSPISSVNKSKLDKAQARRLKMPKRNRSAYFLFSMDVRAKLKTEGQNLTPLETQGKVSQYWRELNAEEKEKYEAKAKDEKVDYLAAMEKFYSNLTPETIAKSKTNKPKKPCSAYAHFVRDTKISLKKENPKLIMQEVLHIVSDRWKNLDAQTRAIYEERAKADKKQYMLETRNFGGDSNSPSLGKRVLDFDSIHNEELLNKQIKAEALYNKSEASRFVSETTYKPVKMEENNVLSHQSLSPMTTRSGSETGLEMAEKLKSAMLLKPEYMINMDANAALAQARFNQMAIPQTQNLFANNFNNMNNMFVNNMNGNMNQQLLANLNMAKAAQANKDLEDAIMRKIIEVKTLQTQRLLFARNMYLQPNNQF